MSTSLPPAFSLGPVSTLQEMLRTIAFVNRSLPFLRPTGRFDPGSGNDVSKDKRFPGDWYRRPANLGRHHECLFAGLQSSGTAPHRHHFFPRRGTDPPRPKLSPAPPSPGYVPCIV